MDICHRLCISRHQINLGCQRSKRSLNLGARAVSEFNAISCCIHFHGFKSPQKFLGLMVERVTNTEAGLVLGSVCTSGPNLFIYIITIILRGKNIKLNKMYFKLF